jgi:hypothetical protein
MIVHKLLAAGALVQIGLSLEESETVDPFADDRIPHVLDAVVLEEQVVPTNDW